MRPEYKSDTSCDRAWEATKYGIQEMKWNIQRKKIEKMLSAWKSLLDVKTAEAYNHMWLCNGNVKNYQCGKPLTGAKKI